MFLVYRLTLNIMAEVTHATNITRYIRGAEETFKTSSLESFKGVILSSW